MSNFGNYSSHLKYEEVKQQINELIQKLMDIIII